MDLKLLSGDYAFSAIWSLRKAELHLYLGDDATVSFDTIKEQSSAANAELTLVLHDFTLNTIKLGNVNNDMISGNVIDLGSNDTYTRTVTLICYDKDQNLLDANSWYIELVMISNHLVLSCPLLLPSIFPSIRVFSSESALPIRWPKY